MGRGLANVCAQKGATPASVARTSPSQAPSDYVIRSLTRLPPFRPKNESVAQAAPETPTQRFPTSGGRDLGQRERAAPLRRPPSGRRPDPGHRLGATPAPRARPPRRHAPSTSCAPRWTSLLGGPAYQPRARRRPPTVSPRQVLGLRRHTTVRDQKRASRRDRPTTLSITSSINRLRRPVRVLAYAPARRRFAPRPTRAQLAEPVQRARGTLRRPLRVPEMRNHNRLPPAPSEPGFEADNAVKHPSPSCLERTTSRNSDECADRRQGARWRRVSCHDGVSGHLLCVRAGWRGPRTGSQH